MLLPKFVSALLQLQPALLQLALAFQALLLPLSPAFLLFQQALPVVFILLLVLLQDFRVQLADDDVAGHGADAQHLSAAVQRPPPAQAADGPGLPAFNLQRKVGHNLVSESFVHHRLDGQRQVGGQINLDVAHGGFQLRGDKDLLAGGQGGQNVTSGSGGANGALHLEEVDAAARGFYHHLSASAAQMNAASGRLGVDAAARPADQDFPARSSRRHRAGGAAQNHVTPRRLRVQRSLNQAHHDYTAAGLQGGVAFDVAHPDAAAGRASPDAVANVAERDAPASGLNRHHPVDVPGGNTAPGGDSFQSSLEGLNCDAAPTGLQLQVVAQRNRDLEFN